MPVNLKKLAVAKGGDLLNIQYSKRKIQCGKFICSIGHIWIMPSNNIQSEWCPECKDMTEKEKHEYYNSQFDEIDKKYNHIYLQTLSKKLREKDPYIRLITDKFTSEKGRYKFKCEMGVHKYIRETGIVGRKILEKDIWCSRCDQTKYNREYWEKFAYEKRGKFLGFEPYFNKNGESVLKVKMICSNNHTWSPFVKNLIQKNVWCSKCSNTNTHEKICRNILEFIFNKPFSSVRPLFLQRKKRGGGLELDGYNEELNLAFEYNGIQHYEYSPLYNKDKTGYLEIQQDNDRYKLKKCKERGIKLLVLKCYDIKNKSDRDIKIHILKELKKIGFPQSQRNKRRLLEHDVRVNIHSNLRELEERKKKIIAKIKQNNGTWMNLDTDLSITNKKGVIEIKCVNGHIYKSSINVLLKKENKKDKKVEKNHRCNTCVRTYNSVWYRIKNPKNYTKVIVQKPNTNQSTYDVFCKKENHKMTYKFGDVPVDVCLVCNPEEFKLKFGKLINRMCYRGYTKKNYRMDEMESVTLDKNNMVRARFYMKCVDDEDHLIDCKSYLDIPETCWECEEMSN